MTIDTEKIIEILSTIANEDQMQVTIAQCIRGGFIAGVAAGVGGLLGGPAGLALGGAAGGVIAAAAGQDFVSVVSILADMEPAKKERLAENVRTILAQIDTVDVSVLAISLSSNGVLRKQIVEAIVSFFHDEMKMAIAR